MHGIVYSAVALYLTCRKRGIIKDDAEWEDMVFFSHHDLPSDFIHSADRYAMVGRFQRILGLPARSLPDIKQDPSLPSRSAIQRNYRVITWTPSLVKQHFEGIKNLHDSGRVFTSNALVDVMLRRLATDEESGKRDQARYNPIGLLSTFKEKLIETQLHFNFDVISFHQKCSMFLTVARDRVGSAYPTMADRRTMRVHHFANTVLVESARIMSQE